MEEKMKDIPIVSSAWARPPFVQAERLQAMAEEHAAQPPTGITREEQLAMQLAWANMSNVQLQIRILQGDLQQAQKLLKEKFDELAVVRDAVIKKYNIDTNTTALDNDGNFIPLTPELRQAQMQAMMGGAMPRV